MDLREAAAAPVDDEPKQAPRQKPRDFWSRASARGWTGEGFEPPPGFEERWGRAAKDGKPGPRRGWRDPDADKRRWAAAFEAARRRGLDPDADRPKPPPRRPQQQRKSNRRMHPIAHARALLRETTLPMAEIAHITRLSVNKVAEIKLKMRAESRRPAGARA